MKLLETKYVHVFINLIFSEAYFSILLQKEQKMNLTLFSFGIQIQYNKQNTKETLNGIDKMAYHITGNYEKTCL